MAGCQCGGRDWPGSCPGPSNCPCCETRPSCKVCHWPVKISTATQGADDEWLCASCAEDQPDEEPDDEPDDEPDYDRNGDYRHQQAERLKETR